MYFIIWLQTTFEIQGCELLYNNWIFCNVPFRYKNILLRPLFLQLEQLLWLLALHLLTNVLFVTQQAAIARCN